MDSQTRQQLEQWLREAQQAKHDLACGKKVVTISYQGRQLSYNQSSVTLEALDKHIRQLEDKLRGRRPRGRKVYF
jgi:hypothetical protein